MRTHLLEGIKTCANQGRKVEGVRNQGTFPPRPNCLPFIIPPAPSLRKKKGKKDLVVVVLTQSASALAIKVKKVGVSSSFIISAATTAAGETMHSH